MITMPTSSDRTIATIGCAEFVTVFVASSRARDGRADCSSSTAATAASSATGAGGGSASRRCRRASSEDVGLRSLLRRRRGAPVLGRDLLDDLLVLGLGLGDRAVVHVGAGHRQADRGLGHVVLGELRDDRGPGT